MGKTNRTQCFNPLPGVVLNFHCQSFPVLALVFSVNPAWVGTMFGCFGLIAIVTFLKETVIAISEL